MRIHVITTGGTIDKVYFDARSEYEVGEPQVVSVFRDAGVTLEVTAESVLRKDSLEMQDEDRRLVRARVEAAPCDRVLITHGTDTMIETARCLAGIPGKTIVLTGSMQPALFRVSDAVFNIGFATGALQCLPPGVYLAMNGRILDPARARKDAARWRFEETSGV